MAEIINLDVNLGNAEASFERFGSTVKKFNDRVEKLAKGMVSFNKALISQVRTSEEADKAADKTSKAVEKEVEATEKQVKSLNKVAYSFKEVGRSGQVLVASLTAVDNKIQSVNAQFKNLKDEAQAAAKEMQQVDKYSRMTTAFKGGTRVSKQAYGMIGSDIDSTREERLRTQKALGDFQKVAQVAPSRALKIFKEVYEGVEQIYTGSELRMAEAARKVIKARTQEGMTRKKLAQDELNLTIKELEISQQKLTSVERAKQISALGVTAVRPGMLGRESLTEAANYRSALDKVIERANKLKLASVEVQQVWDNVRLGKSLTELDPKLLSVHDGMVRLHQMAQRLGNEAERTATRAKVAADKEAAANAKKLEDLRKAAEARRLEAIEAARAAKFDEARGRIIRETLVTKFASGGKPAASQKEWADFDAKASRAIIQINRLNLSAREIQLILNAISLGNLSLLPDNLKRVASSMLTAANAARAFGTETRRLREKEMEGLLDSISYTSNASKKLGSVFTLSFQSMERLLAIQLAHAAFGRFLSALRQSIITASEFEIKIGQIRTIAQDSQMTLEQWALGLRRVSDAYNLPILDAATAAYNALSNQVARGAQILDFLSAAAKFAKVTVSSLEDSVNLLSSAINSYGIDVSATEVVAAKFFKAIDLGRFTAQEAANTIGRLLISTSSVGISLDESLGALSTLTIKGVRYSEAFTLVTNITQKLRKPTEEMLKLYRQWGVETGEAAIKTFGFQGVLNKLIEATRAGTGGPQMAELFPEIRGMRGIEGLIADVNEFDSTVKKIATVNFEQYSQAFQDAIAPVGFKIQQEFNKVKNFFVNDFGVEFLKTVKGFTDLFGGSIPAVKLFTSALFSLGTAGVIAFAWTKHTKLVEFRDNVIKSIEAVRTAKAALAGGLIDPIAIKKTEESLARHRKFLLNLYLGVGLAAGTLLLTGFQYYYARKEEIERKAHENRLTRLKEEQLQEDFLRNQALAQDNDFFARAFRFVNQGLARRRQEIGVLLTAQEKASKDINKDLSRTLSMVGRQFEDFITDYSNAIARSKTELARLEEKKLNEPRKQEEQDFESNLALLDDAEEKTKALEERLAKLIAELAPKQPLRTAQGLVQDSWKNAAIDLMKSFGIEPVTPTDVNAATEKAFKSIDEYEKEQKTLENAIKVAQTLFDESARETAKTKKDLGKLDEAKKNAELMYQDDALRTAVLLKLDQQRADLQNKMNRQEAVRNQLLDTQKKLRDQLKSSEDEETEALKKKVAQDEASKEKAEAYLEEFRNLSQDIRDYKLPEKFEINMSGTFASKEDELVAAKQAIQQAGENEWKKFSDMYKKAMKAIEQSGMGDTKKKLAIEALNAKKREVNDAIFARMNNQFLAAQADVFNSATETFNMMRNKAKETPTIELTKFNETVGKFKNLFSGSSLDPSVTSRLAKLPFSASITKDLGGLSAGFDILLSKLQKVNDIAALSPTPEILQQQDDLVKQVEIMSAKIQETIAKAFPQGMLTPGFTKEERQELENIAKTLGILNQNLGKDFESFLAKLGQTQQSDAALKKAEEEIVQLKAKFEQLGIDPARFVEPTNKIASAAAQFLEAANIIRYSADKFAGQGKAKGGIIKGFAYGGLAASDTVPAMLTPGEFVMNKESTRRFYPLLALMNSAGNNKGNFGRSVSTTVGDINITVQGGSNSNTTIREIARGLKKGIQRGTIALS